MAHYAFLDDDNLVTEVIVGRDEDDLAEGVTSWEDYYGAFRGQRCFRTSYNTQAGAHAFGDTPLRKNYAGIGYTYDKERDAFIPPQPFESWVLNEDTCLWEAPVPYPADGMYTWDEETGAWVEVTDETE
jgi:hypothetical protein